MTRGRGKLGQVLAPRGASHTPAHGARAGRKPVAKGITQEAPAEVTERCVGRAGRATKPLL